MVLFDFKSSKLRSRLFGRDGGPALVPEMLEFGLGAFELKKS